MNDVLGVITRQRALNFRPGEKYSYTNSGYNLLVMIAEKVTGQSFAKWSRENLFEALGLAQTQWRDSFRRVVEQRAIAYTRTPDGYMQLMPFEDAYGNGGLLTTVGDLLKWNKALDGGRLGSVVTSGLQERGLLNSGRRIAYARGLVVSTYRRGHPKLRIPARPPGYRAWLGRYPEQQHLSIALLCNSTEAETVAFAHRIVDAVLASSPLQPVPPTIALGAKHAAALAGTFVDERNGMLMKLENVEGRLVVARGSELEAISESRFRMKDAMLEFDGPGAFDLQTGDGPAVKYRRAASYSPSPADLAGFAGTYVSDEADATYVVTVKEGHLVMTLQDRPTQTFELTPAYPQAFATPDSIVSSAGIVPVVIPSCIWVWIASGTWPFVEQTRISEDGQLRIMRGSCRGPQAQPADSCVGGRAGAVDSSISVIASPAPKEFLARRDSSGNLATPRHQVQLVHHPTELRDGCCVDLSHRVAPMHLHGGSRDAHIAGPLVQTPRCDLRQNGVLARCQDLESRPQFFQCLFTLAAFAVANQPNVGGVEKILISKGLREELDCARLHRLHANRSRHATVMKTVGSLTLAPSSR